ENHLFSPPCPPCLRGEPAHPAANRTLSHVPRLFPYNSTCSRGQYRNPVRLHTSPPPPPPPPPASRPLPPPLPHPLPRPPHAPTISRRAPLPLHLHLHPRPPGGRRLPRPVPPPPRHGPRYPRVRPLRLPTRIRRITPRAPQIAPTRAQEHRRHPHHRPLPLD